jgi:hypothetical protein
MDYWSTVRSFLVELPGQGTKRCEEKFISKLTVELNLPNYFLTTG